MSRHLVWHENTELSFARVGDQEGADAVDEEHGEQNEERENYDDDDMAMMIMIWQSWWWHGNGDNDMNFPTLWRRSGNVFHGLPTTFDHYIVAHYIFRYISAHCIVGN